MSDAPAAPYCGCRQDRHVGRIVLDGWLSGLLPETGDCAGRDLGRMQRLMEQVQAEWDKHGGLPSRLPQALRQRHAALYTRAMQQARDRGWNPELGDED